MPSDPSPPASDLDALARKLYFRLRAAIREQERWSDSDRDALSQTCRYEQRAREARKALADGGEGLLSEGYKGQPTEHPLIRLAVQNERLYFDALKELGLTPRSREQLGVRPAAGGGRFAR